MDDSPSPFRLSRRAVLGLAGLGVTAGTLSVLRAGEPPRRKRHRPPLRRSDIQHDIGEFLAPAERVDGTLFRFGPTYTLFLTYELTRTPTRADQRLFDDALATIEDSYPPRAAGVFAMVAYGLPYFDRLARTLVDEHLPTLAQEPNIRALAEALPAPTDVTAGNPAIRKKRFHMPVRIEQNDVLLSLRSDSVEVLSDVAAWLAGSDELAGVREPSPGLDAVLQRTSSRLMFLERGMPRRLADATAKVYASRVHPQSPMWMGFADQQADASGPAEITTFLGTPEVRLTTARDGDYFDRASVQHLSHNILDLEQYYLGEGGSGRNSESYFVRAQYMFRSTPPPAAGADDQVTDGGGPAFLPNRFLGPDDAEAGARGVGTPDGVRRIGHVTALQRSSRAPDGTPLHIRVDGPGFDALDIAGGDRTPKLHFSIFVPTAETFARMRRAGAAVDLAERHRVPQADNGLERFVTTTRRQNFLSPPRRHRAFPLVELG